MTDPRRKLAGTMAQGLTSAQVRALLDAEVRSTEDIRLRTMAQTGHRKTSNATHRALVAQGLATHLLKHETAQGMDLPRLTDLGIMVRNCLLGTDDATPAEERPVAPFSRSTTREYPEQVFAETVPGELIVRLLAQINEARSIVKNREGHRVVGPLSVRVTVTVEGRQRT